MLLVYCTVNYDTKVLDYWQSSMTAWTLIWQTVSVGSGSAVGSDNYQGLVMAPNGMEAIPITHVWPRSLAGRALRWRPGRDRRGGSGCQLRSLT